MSTSNTEDELDNPLNIILWALSVNGYQPKQEKVYCTIQTDRFVDDAVQKLQSLIHSENTKAIERFVEGLEEKAEELNNGELDKAHRSGLAVPVTTITQALEDYTHILRSKGF